MWIKKKVIRNFNSITHISDMATTEPKKVKLKLMIDKRNNKVLFAEAEIDFVDVLFNLISLTFSTATRLLGNQMVGCMGNLCETLEKLNEAYNLHPNQNNSQLQKLDSAASVLFSPQSCLPQPKFYTCSSKNTHLYVTNDINTLCPKCQYYSLSRELQPLKTELDREVGIVKKLVTYMVTDDLLVSPGSMISSIGLLQGILKDMSDLEEKVVEIDTDKVLELLKVSLQFKEALTTIFLKKKECKDEAVTDEN